VQSETRRVLAVELKRSHFGPTQLAVDYLSRLPIITSHPVGKFDLTAFGECLKPGDFHMP
jgi:hypothetical protein